MIDSMRDDNSEGDFADSGPEGGDDFCAWLFGVIDSAPIEEIRRHIESCTDCAEALDEAWAFYRGEGPMPAAGLFYLPAGIRTKGEYLERWQLEDRRLLKAEIDAAEQLRLRLSDPAVFAVTQRFRQSQSMAMSLMGHGSPPVIMAGAFDVVAAAYRKLYDVLGYDAFWLYVKGPDHMRRGTSRPEGPADLQRILDWWRKALGG